MSLERPSLLFTVSLSDLYEMSEVYVCSGARLKYFILSELSAELGEELGKEDDHVHSTSTRHVLCYFLFVFLVRMSSVSTRNLEHFADEQEMKIV